MFISTFFIFLIFEKQLISIGILIFILVLYTYNKSQNENNGYFCSIFGNILGLFTIIDSLLYLIMLVIYSDSANSGLFLLLPILFWLTFIPISKLFLSLSIELYDEQKNQHIELSHFREINNSLSKKILLILPKIPFIFLVLPLFLGLMYSVLIWLLQLLTKII